MKISYNWLSEYLPEKIAPEKLSNILTSVGLEVESLEKFEEIKGSLEGLVIGEVTECIKHPEADNLKLTKVRVGKEETLQIVCGAPNVATGQKVVVATLGTTLYPLNGEPVRMKKARIRGFESQGMICAEDEIGVGEGHEGIIVLPENSQVGTEASAYFKPFCDKVFELGITPNRMDAMSHLGVAKDVCAYLSHQSKKNISVLSPFKNNFKADNHNLKIDVTIENAKSCQRYSGVSISNVKVAQSPKWMQQKLKSIGLRPVNNIVDITNYILHETGQPLHAFDADKVKEKIIVKNLPDGTLFTTLDEKERKLHHEDLMICNESEEPMCIAGVFGGSKSGVTENTQNIFLESAWFEPVAIRRTSLRHNLRTEASSRFEKGVDISKIVTVLKRAALMIKEIAGGEIASDIVDVYPDPKERTHIVLKNHYLKKISGKNYHAETVKNILQSLDFEILKEGLDDLRVTVPFSKPDVKLPVDIIEEIMRIDGYDNVDIPCSITISPAIEKNEFELLFKEKIADYLVGLGFSEILTNSITNSAYYSEEGLASAVHLLNNLTTELNIMRPWLLETGLERISYNLNHKNNDLMLFEFGKSYSTGGTGKYREEDHLSLFVSGNKSQTGWKIKSCEADIYFLKGVCEKLFQLSGIDNIILKTSNNSIEAFFKNELIAKIEMPEKNKLQSFSIKQAVFFADIAWNKLVAFARDIQPKFTELSKYPEVRRDISMLINKSIPFDKVQDVTSKLKIKKLSGIQLFDIFESEKLPLDQRSLAISFTFSDKEKTLTDKEIDSMMNKIITTYEKELGVEIRKK